VVSSYLTVLSVLPIEPTTLSIDKLGRIQWLNIKAPHTELQLEATLMNGTEISYLLVLRRT
jgi:hypothetical protein